MRHISGLDGASKNKPSLLYKIWSKVISNKILDFWWLRKKNRPTLFLNCRKQYRIVFFLLNILSNNKQILFENALAKSNNRNDCMDATGKRAALMQFDSFLLQSYVQTCPEVLEL